MRKKVRLKTIATNEFGITNETENAQFKFHITLHYKFILP